MNPKRMKKADLVTEFTKLQLNNKKLQESKNEVDELLEKYKRSVTDQKNLNRDVTIERDNLREQVNTAHEKIEELNGNVTRLQETVANKATEARNCKVYKYAAIFLAVLLFVAICKYVGLIVAYLKPLDI